MPGDAIPKPRVVVVSTGGTIASCHDPASRRASVSKRADDLLAELSRFAALPDVGAEDFLSIDSNQMTIEQAFALAQHVEGQLARPEVIGVVVTHGTDTMEESCYLADLLIASDKPVIFTGAQRFADEADCDGPRNLADAVLSAASPATYGQGVLVCFDGELHAARDVAKVHTSAVRAFCSRGRGPIGVIDGQRAIVFRARPSRRHFPVTRLETRVDLIRLAMDLGVRQIEAAVRDGMVGVVIEAFGRGNTPPAVVGAVRRAVESGVAVVITSRCAAGRVAPISGGAGCGQELAEIGAVFAGDLAGPKARLLLMVLLSDPHTRSHIGTTFAELAP